MDYLSDGRKGDAPLQSARLKYGHTTMRTKNYYANKMSMNCSAAPRCAMPDSLEMNDHIRELLYATRDAVREVGDLIEVIEGRSICYYDDSASFFAETLPMAHRIRLLLPIDFDESDDPEGVATDATKFKFLQNVAHRDCGTFVDIWRKQQIAATIPLLRQAFNVSEE